MKLINLVFIVVCLQITDIIIYVLAEDQEDKCLKKVDR